MLVECNDLTEEYRARALILFAQIGTIGHLLK